MNAYARRIFFWTSVCLFFITAGLIIFYALGYRFNSERGVFIYTGSITIKANPSVVNISLDGKPRIADINRLNESYHIAGIKPGEHFVEVNAPGYQTWSKKVVVNSGISTEFWNIILPRENYEETAYPTPQISKAFPGPKSNLLAYFSHSADDQFSVSVLDTDTSQTEQVFTENGYIFPEEDKENIEWSINSDRLAIPLKKDNQKEYFIVNTETKEVLNLAKVTGADNIRSVRWDSAQDNILFYISDNNLYQINIDDPTQKQLISDSVQSYDISGGFTYIFEIPTGIVYRIRLNNPEDRIQITTVPLEKLDDARYSIIVYDEQRLSLINYYTGNLFVYNKGETETHFIQLSANAQGAQFSNDGKKLLYWTDWEIFTYFTRDWEAQPERLENSILNVSRFSQPIKSVHWEKDYEHIIFSVGKDIKIIELDHRGERSIFNIATLPMAPIQVLSNFIEGMVLYITQDQNEQGPVLKAIKFPEAVSFFSFGG